MICNRNQHLHPPLLNVSSPLVSVVNIHLRVLSHMNNYVTVKLLKLTLPCGSAWPRTFNDLVLVWGKPARNLNVQCSSISLAMSCPAKSPPQWAWLEVLLLQFVPHQSCQGRASLVKIVSLIGGGYFNPIKFHSPTKLILDL